MARGKPKRRTKATFGGVSRATFERQTQKQLHGLARGRKRPKNKKTGKGGGRTQTGLIGADHG